MYSGGIVLNISVLDPTNIQNRESRLCWDFLWLYWCYTILQLHVYFPDI